MILSDYIIISIFTAIILTLSIWLFVIDRRIKKLLSGKNAESLEGVIGALGEDIRALISSQERTSAYLKTAEERLKKSIQNVEMIRFNAFKGNGEGGNQSFAVAFLSENGDGAVISSLYTRDRVNVFAKPIKDFTSPFEMSEEEREAIAQAKR
ncbi:MAG: DUF4446 family protein [Candidatus Yonathbacteria bacterium]|nr:DUF4446 family protein [Candidatus Yonathbacteria bacterium]